MTLMRPRSSRPQAASESPSQNFASQLATRDSVIPDAEEATPIEVGDFLIETSSHRVWVRGVEVKLTAREFKLLTFFSRHPQELLGHKDLVEALSRGSRPSSREYLRALVRSVREKIEQDTPPRYIVTQPLKGYRFIPRP
jgi:DNA-binding response OmpR family regulator